jgi:hypothetical protein
MPNIEDLINKYGKEITSETAEFRNAMGAGVPRDSEKRPWSSAAESASQTYGPPPITKWYGSFTGIREAVLKHKLMLFTAFFGGLMVLVGVAQFVPDSYNSVLNLYAPERTDSVSSRLQLFSGRVEFAGFPVDFKIPLGLTARRLRSDRAKEWVLKQYAQRPHDSRITINPDLIHADTFYAEGSELLVIQGYANAPQIAADVTNLYWEYLETEIGGMRKEHLHRVNQWLALTASNLQAKLDDLNLKASAVSDSPMALSRAQLNSKLADTYADAEVKRIRTQKQLDELAAALNHRPELTLTTLWSLPYPELQDLRQVHSALALQQETDTSPLLASRLKSIDEQAVTLAKKLLEQRRLEFDSLTNETQKLKTQIDLQMPANTLQGQRDLLTQQTQTKLLLSELDALKAQLAVEFDIAPSRLRVIQPALPDFSTRRPSLVVKYSACALAALMLSILSLAWAQRKVVYLNPRAAEAFENSLRGPQPSGAGV